MFGMCENDANNVLWLDAVSKMDNGLVPRRRWCGLGKMSGEVMKR